nr:ATP-binding protein [uncultured Pedobacter sp.]
MINFSRVIFGKDLNNLTYQDIETYFVEEKDESNNIEFKAFSKKYGNFNDNIKGIIRAICGILNSEGGIVIWGAPVGVVDADTKEKKFQGNLSPVLDYKEKDWIINKISDNITPLPIGIKVTVLQQSINENLYIFEIQPSPYKPHQYDNTYFVRLDGQTKPAPHYFVEALFRKISYPNIEGYIKFNSAYLIQNPSRYIIDFTVFLFNFSKMQNEKNVIYRLLVVPGLLNSQAEKKQPFSLDGKEDLLHFGTPMMKNDKIILTVDELTKNDFSVSIVLTIGGEKSPVKASNYKLNLKNINLDNPEDISDLIIELNENQLLSEKQEQMGTTRSTTLTQALGREYN